MTVTMEGFDSIRFPNSTERRVHPRTVDRPSA